jgi:predicted membrane metal-binding protein
VSWLIWLLVIWLSLLAVGALVLVARRRERLRDRVSPVEDVLARSRARFGPIA